MDIQHVKTVHHLDFIAEPQITQTNNFSIRLNLEIKISRKNIFEKLIYLLSQSQTLKASFTTWGSNMASIETNIGKLPVCVLFTHRLTLEGGSYSQTFLFLPTIKKLRWIFRLDLVIRFIVKFLLGCLLVGDIKILENLKFENPKFLKVDSPLKMFISLVEELGYFSPGL